MHADVKTKNSPFQGCSPPFIVRCNVQKSLLLNFRRQRSLKTILKTVFERSTICSFNFVMSPIETRAVMTAWLLSEILEYLEQICVVRIHCAGVGIFWPVKQGLKIKNNFHFNTKTASFELRQFKIQQCENRIRLAVQSEAETQLYT